jgi:hypothetical protein
VNSSGEFEAEAPDLAVLTTAATVEASNPAVLTTAVVLADGTGAGEESGPPL